MFLLLFGRSLSLDHLVEPAQLVNAGFETRSSVVVHLPVK